MKLAVLSESSADEAAIRILVNGILGTETETIALEVFRPRRGFDTVLRNIPQILSHLYYQTETDALAVVLDSDRPPIHQAAHAEPGKVDADCRYCTLQKKITETEGKLGIGPGQPGKRPDRKPVKIAIGLAVPQIEAWLLCGKDRQVSEATWLVGLKSGNYPYTSAELKRKVYGKDRYTLEEEAVCMVREAQRLVTDKLADLEEKWFPCGFGTFAQTIRAWQQNP